MYPESKQSNSTMIRNKHTALMLKMAILAIYVAYACSITFFTHTHIINGVTIVHSHPFESDESGNSSHTHNGATIQLIQVLSSYYTNGGPIADLFTIIDSPNAIGLTIPTPQTTFISKSGEEIQRLRPPPTLS